MKEGVTPQTADFRALWGQTLPEAMGILTGETGSPASGAIRMLGKEVNTLNPIQRRMLGAVFLPEERLGQAAVAEMTLSENTFLTSADQMHFDKRGWINWPAVANFSNQIIDDFDGVHGVTWSNSRGGGRGE